jgi:hypothetical protein
VNDKSPFLFLKEKEKKQKEPPSKIGNKTNNKNKKYE